MKVNSTIGHRCLTPPTTSLRSSRRGRDPLASFGTVEVEARHDRPSSGLRTTRDAPRPTDGVREGRRRSANRRPFVVGLLVGFVLAAATALGIALSERAPAATRPTATARAVVVTSDDFVGVTPTAAWPFRAEWLTPRPGPG